MAKSIAALRTPFSLLVAALAGMAAGTATAQEQEREEITVEAVREKPVGRAPATGAPIIDLSIERRVSYADLSLTTQSGVTVLENRIRDAARSACRELEQKYPVGVGNGDKCFKGAVESAMADAQEAIDAAERRAVASGR